ncbi:ABC transporter substrate-binding protein [Mycoplasma sp. 392]
MKKNNLLKLLSTLPLASIALVPAIAVSCGSNEEIKLSYDLGLTAEPINNLNYVRYKSMDKILPSLVDAFLKNGPTTNLKSIIQTNNFYMSMVDTSKLKDSSNFDDFFNISKDKLKEKNGYGEVGGSYYGIHDFQILGGTGRPSLGADPTRLASLYAFRNPRNPNNYMAVTGFVNDQKNRWSNGDFVTAADIRAYLEYILDLNTGSQKLNNIEKIGLKGVDEFIAIQKEYALKFGRNYKNPFGYRKYIEAPWSTNDKKEYIEDASEEAWSSQVPGDQEYVEKIKKAAKNIGFYTGQIFRDYTNEEVAKSLSLTENKAFSINSDIQDFTILKNGKTYKVKLIKNEFLNPYQSFTVDSANGSITADIATLSNDENAFTIVFDENKTPSLAFLLSQVLDKLYPINRKYVEMEAGGIDNYGSEPSKFLTSGPFIIKDGDVVLGPQGYLILTKNKDYFDADNVISNKIKIYFSTDKTINSTLFEDGYVSQAYIPANKINNYWSDPVYKQYLNKNSGYGTIAFGFNLDNETNAQSYIQDQDLRNAIYYAVDREAILKSVGWDFSFPVITWTAFGQYKAADGKNIELYFNDQDTLTRNNVKLPIQNYDFFVHQSKSYNFEKTDRRDLAYSQDIAKYYLNRFKAKHPGLKSISLRYINNSTDEHKKAGQYLKEALKVMSDGFIVIENKSLPENTYASWIEEGKYDIIYQNYDRIGGSGASDYVVAFFKTDEIDSLSQKNIGFKNNPVGSFTYADYLSDYVLQALQNSGQSDLTKEKAVLPYINKVLEEINDVAADEFQNADSTTKQSDFVQKYAQVIAKSLALTAESKDENLWTDTVVKNALEYHWTTNDNIKASRINRLFNLYVKHTYTINQIIDFTKQKDPNYPDEKSLEERLMIDEHLENATESQPDYWAKFIDLAYQREGESLVDYTARLNAFFSGNFTKEEREQYWDSEANIFQFIALLEKVVRDASPVVPLMEVDTNWEITKVGGTSSLYTFNLQYAYDVTKPPRPGLPRQRGT